MQIQSDFLRESRRLFGRLRRPRGASPVLTHVLVTTDIHGITLAVSDGEHWLETFRRSSPEPGGPEKFLLPGDAMAAACRADKGTFVVLTPRGPYSRRELHVAARCCGAVIESIHPSEKAGDFPVVPVIAGTPTLVPARTMQSLAIVAGCAATGEGQVILNGVLFTPTAGGHLVATDSHRLACIPATVPARGFVLPNAAVRVLTHPDFRGYENEVTLPDRKDDPYVMFRAWDHLMVVRLPQGHYPDRRLVIPEGMTELATLADDRRVAVIAWLRFLPDTRTPVHLGWEIRGCLTLTQRATSNSQAMMQVPAQIRGRPPAVAFHPRHLADALEIGSTLSMRDDVTPIVCHHPGGGFCLLTPVSIGSEVKTSAAPAPIRPPRAA